MLTLLSLTAALFGSVLAADTAPRAVAQTALRAVEADSVRRVRAAWLRRVVEDPRDPAPILGLATLARLTYDAATADSLYRVLLRAEVGPAWRTGAEIGGARLAIADGRFAAADSLLAVATARAVATFDSAGATEALTARATVLVRMRGVPPADSALEQARRLAPARDPALQAEWLCTAAAVAFRAERAEALGIAWRGAAAAARARAPRIEASCLGVAAGALRVRVGADTALALYGEAIRLARGARDRAGLAVLLQWRGYERRLQLDLGGARRDLLEAVREGEASGGRSVVSWALLNLGLLSSSVNDVDQGRAFARQATERLRAEGDRRGLEVAQQLDAGLALRAGDLVVAERLYDQARVIAEQLGAHSDLVWIASALGRLALARGDAAGAGRWLARARDEARAGHDAGGEAGLDYHFGMVALRRGDYAAARRLFGADVRLGDAYVQFRAHARLAEIDARTAGADRGAGELRAALDALDTARARLPAGELRARVLDATLDYLDPDLGIATVIAALARSGHAADALVLAERRRAQELLEELIRGDALRDRAAEGVARGAPRRAFGLPALQRGLAARHTALVLFVTGMGGEPTTVFAVSADTVRAFAAPPIDSLAGQVAAFRDQVEGGVWAPVLGRALAAALLDSALASFPTELRTVAIVADHGLFDLPVDALPDSDGAALVTRYAIETAPSAGVLLQLWDVPRPATAAARILALGDPDFAARAGDSAAPHVDPLRNAFEAAGLRRLPAAAREARLVARFGASSTLRLGREASEAWLERVPLGDFRVLHFATHALVSDQSVSRTGLALAPGDGADGFLGPDDLSGLALDADLVVLSGCRTARGVPLLGEGIRGLAAPLVAAGARAVVATAWDVPDGPMVPLMRDFYAALAGGASIADALQRAKVAAYERGAPPRVWAALVLYGDGASRVPLTAPGRLRRSWWLALLGLAGLGALGAAQLRRAQRETVKA